MPDSTVEQVQHFIRHVRKYIEHFGHSLMLLRQMKTPERYVGTNEQLGRKALEAEHAGFGEVVVLKSLATELVPALIRRGESAKPVLDVIHTVDGGGGLEVLLNKWGDIKVALQETVLRLGGVIQPGGCSTDADPAVTVDGTANQTLPDLLEKDADGGFLDNDYTSDERQLLSLLWRKEFVPRDVVVKARRKDRKRLSDEDEALNKLITRLNQKLCQTGRNWSISKGDAKIQLKQIT